MMEWSRHDGELTPTQMPAHIYLQALIIYVPDSSIDIKFHENFPEPCFQENKLNSPPPLSADKRQRFAAVINGYMLSIADRSGPINVFRRQSYVFVGFTLRYNVLLKAHLGRYVSFCHLFFSTFPVLTVTWIILSFYPSSYTDKDTEQHPLL